MDYTTASGMGQSTGKVILMGEHAVVHHQPAIAIPFSGVSVQSDIQPSSHPLSIHCDFYSGLAYEMPEVLKSLKFTIHEALNQIEQLRPELGITPTTRSYWNNGKVEKGEASFVQAPSIEITITSSIPAERGMGSSAAVSVAVVRGLFDYYNVPLSDTLLFEIVQASEKIAHGNPSGIDTATTSGKEAVFFIKGEALQPLSIQLKGTLIVADTGITGQTLKAVQAVQEKIQQEPISTQKIIEEIGELVHTAKTCLAKGDVHTLGSLLSQNHALLQQLEVSNETLDHLVQTALENGAIGAKMTGGGLGGCMIALAVNLEEAQKIAEALQQAGAVQTWIHSFSNE